jgi:hypothetical protein
VNAVDVGILYIWTLFERNRLKRWLVVVVGVRANAVLTNYLLVLVSFPVHGRSAEEEKKNLVNYASPYFVFRFEGEDPSWEVLFSSSSSSFRAGTACIVVRVRYGMPS